jgi:hypothetical protein
MKQQIHQPSFSAWKLTKNSNQQAMQKTNPPRISLSGQKEHKPMQSIKIKEIYLFHKYSGMPNGILSVCVCVCASPILRQKRRARLFLFVSRFLRRESEQIK